MLDAITSTQIFVASSTGHFASTAGTLIICNIDAGTLPACLCQLLFKVFTVTPTERPSASEVATTVLLLLCEEEKAHENVADAMMKPVTRCRHVMLRLSILLQEEKFISQVP